jgi:hypothetical protein
MMEETAASRSKGSGEGVFVHGRASHSHRCYPMYVTFLTACLNHPAFNYVVSVKRTDLQRTDLQSGGHQPRQ